ncbi:CopD family protein [Nocardia concava]|uniref:CopD family protein n=1 Tax=Nocardia concava TaxID=257281 RepID=UPI0009FDF6C6|nr:CopD family protein [Nocardia concava]
MEVSLAAASQPAVLPPWWRVFSMVAYFIGLSAVIGGTMVYLLVLRPVLRTDIDATDRRTIRNRFARMLAWCGPLLLLTAYLQLAGRVARKVKGVSFEQSLVPHRIWSYLRAPAEPGSWVSSGTEVLVQNALFALAAAALLSLFFRGRPDAVAAAALTLTVAGSLVISVPTKWAGLTADAQLDTWLTQAHIIGGCTWLGGLLALAALARARPFGERAGLCWARVWQRFSSVALVAVGVVVASGSWMTWRHVGAVDQLVSTTYGRFLLAKLFAVAALVAAGAYNQLVLTPRIAAAHARGDLGRGFVLTLRHFPAVVTVEAAVGLCVLLIVPFLTGSARAQAGYPAAPGFDGGVLALAMLLIATLAASLYATYRVSLLRTRAA